MFGMKRKRAIKALKEELGIDVYQSGTYQNEIEKKYSVHILDGYDCVAIINCIQNDRLISKDWYIYSWFSGWVKKGSMNRKQCIELYRDTNPYYVRGVLLESKNGMTPEFEESIARIICDEYMSTYMTQRYFHFSIDVTGDYAWMNGESVTEAIYMPKRMSDPAKRSAAEIERHNKEIDALAEEIGAAIRNDPNLFSRK